MTESINYTMEDQSALRKIVADYLDKKGYAKYENSEKNHISSDVEKFYIKGATYTSIYDHSGRSEFLVVDRNEDTHLRIEIKFQKTSGSVDEKLPYLYLNSVLSHKDDVLILVEGRGFKPGAKKWLKQRVEENWLVENEKKLYVMDLLETIKFIEEKL